MNDDANAIIAYQRINNTKTTTNKSFKTKIIGKRPNDSDTLDTEVVVPLTYLSIFWRFLDLIAAAVSVNRSNPARAVT